MRNTLAGPPILALCSRLSGWGRASLVLTLLALVVWAGCQKKEDKSRKNLGGLAADIATDTRLLGDATAAANEIVRNAQDCEAVKAALPEAQRKLDEVGPKLLTQTGRDTLERLKIQVRNVAQNCP